MQRDVVEHRHHAVVLEVLDQGRTLSQVRHLKVEHVGVVLASLGDGRELDLAGVRKRLQLLIVEVPRGQAVVVDLVRALELRPKICRVEVALQVGAAGIDPGVLVHLPAEEALAVRALLADNLGALDVFRLVNDDGAALPHRVVLGLVEAVAPEVSDGSEGTALVRAHDALCGILDHDEVVTACDVDDGVHLAGHAGVVHRNNHAGAVGDGRLNLRLVDIHRVRADVDKDELSADRHESRRSAREGEAGKDHLVAGLKAAEVRCHLERIGSGGCEQDLLGVEALLHPGVALARERAVSADLVVNLGGLADVIHLGAHIGRYVKVDHRASPNARE